MTARAAVLGALALALAAPEAAPALTPTGLAPTAYRLDLAYSGKGAGRLTGTQTVSFVNRGSPTSTVWLRLWANGPDGCRPRRIRVTPALPAVAGALRARCTAVPITLGSPVATGASRSVTLSLSIRGRRALDRFGRSRNGARLFGNVIPVLAVEDERGLHLERYARFAESFYSLSAGWSATLELPARLRAATTGAVTAEHVSGGRRVLQVSTPAARDFALAIGRFRVRQRQVAGVRVRVHTPRRGGHGRRIARQASGAVRFFARRFGAYGSPELDLVEIDEPYGMEYPELVFSLAERDIVVHEVAHQWWYSLVGNNQYREPWLDESFTQYSTLLTSRGGFRYCRLRRPFSILRGRARGARLDWTMRRFARRPSSYFGAVYEVGPCALRSLERGLGRARMRTLLHTLVARHRHGVMTKADVLRAIQEVAPPGFNLSSWQRRAHLS